MGTDIHIFWEAKSTTGQWFMFSNENENFLEFEIYRRYQLFSLLADGARYHGRGGYPVRGLPGDMSQQLKELMNHNDGYHSHSWLNLNEFNKVIVCFFAEERLLKTSVNIFIDETRINPSRYQDLDEEVLHYMNFKIIRGSTNINSIITGNRFNEHDEWVGFNYIPFFETLDQFTGGLTDDNVRVVFMFDS